MSHAMEVFEIVDLVLKCLAEDRCFGSILHVSIAKRGLFEVAMDELWGRDCLLPFEVLQPLVASGAIGWNSPLEDFPRLIPRRPLSLADWKRFCLYARRVQSLWWDTSEVDARILPNLARSAGTNSLFPRLRHLVFHPDRDPPDEALPAYNQLIPPSLSAFQMMYRRIPADSRSKAMSIIEFWLGCLTLQCSNLRNFAISVDTTLDGYEESKILQFSSRAQLSFQRLLRSLKNLQEISIHTKGFSLDIIPYLAALPSLKRLGVGPRPSLNHRNPPRHYRESTSVSSFPTLRILHFTPTNDPHMDIGRVVELSRNSPLYEIYLEWDMEGPTSLQEVLVAYAEPQDALAETGTLSSLHLVCNPLATQRLSEDPVTISHLYSLFAPRYRQLVHLSIQYPFVDLNDDDMAAIARWLPNLKTLALGSAHGRSRQDWDIPRVTIRGVLALQMGCPDLHKLSLSVDLGTRTDLKELEGGSYPTRFSCWDVLYSRIEQPKEVAIVLASLFPGLVSLSWRAGDRLGSAELEIIESFLLRTSKLRRSTEWSIPFNSQVWENYWM